MKKYSSTTRENLHRTSRKVRLGLLLLVGIGFIGLILLLPTFLGGVGSFIFSPIVAFENWMSESKATIPSYFRDRKVLTEQIKQLEREIEYEKGDETTLQQLRTENQELRELFGMGTTTRIAAGVIGRPTNTPYDVLILDKGTRNGVQQYAPVYLGPDQVIGFVSAVYRETSVVVLATTPDVESTVYIFGPNIYTTAKGMGGGVLKVSVPQGVVITVGDVVAVPSFGEGMYGRISYVESNITEPEQQGFVTLPVPLNGLRVVSVGSTPLKPLSFEDASTIVHTVRTELFTVPVPSGVLVDTEIGTSTQNATSTGFVGESQSNE